LENKGIGFDEVRNLLLENEVYNKLIARKGEKISDTEVLLCCKEACILFVEHMYYKMHEEMRSKFARNLCINERDDYGDRYRNIVSAIGWYRCIVNQDEISDYTCESVHDYISDSENKDIESKVNNWYLKLTEIMPKVYPQLCGTALDMFGKIMKRDEEKEFHTMNWDEC